MRVVAEPRTISRQLADFAVSLTADDIPSEVIEAAELHLLDLVGVALASHAIGAGTHAARASAMLGGAGDSSVIGRSDGAPPSVAALANGTLAHAIEFDDTHTRSICHISTVVIPTALAVAEATGSSGREALAASVIGNEVIARIGTAAAPAYMQTGFHPTSVCGVFGATVVAGRLRGLTEEQMVNALGIAGSFASGIFEYLGDGTETKPLHAGWAAQAGVSAALLAEHGGEGPGAVFEGRFGLYATHLRMAPGQVDTSDWDLGTRWETPAISFKPYPACHFIAGGLDAARAMLAGGLEVGAIDEIVLGVPAPAVPLVLEPTETKTRPRTAFEAKFSLPFSLASMLVHGDVDVTTYALDRLNDERVLSLAGRVRHEVESFAAYPDVLPVRVNVRLGDGTEVSELSPQGDEPPPFGVDEVREKFGRNASMALDAQDRDALEADLLALESVDDLHEALAPLRRAG
jgi:2-methylcitrate dehydratase PrpD